MMQPFAAFITRQKARMRSLPAHSVRTLAVLCVALPAACSHRSQTDWQGYAEGEYVYLASSQSGTLTQLWVQRGQNVNAGAPLFALDAVNETAALQQAQRQLDAAQALLADLHTGKRPPEVRVTEAQLVQARANAHKAALQLARDEAQLKAGGISQAQLDESRALAQTTAAQVRELQNQVRVAHLPGRAQQIVAQAEQVKAAQAVVAQAQWRLDQKRVAAPAAGFVQDTLFRVGEWVQAGNPVVQLLPPQNMKVRFFVPETVLGGLAAGRKVAMHCDGCGADIPATITFISSSAEYTPPVIFSNDNRAKFVFMVEARPTPADAMKLHPGQPVEVRLQ